MKFPIFTCAALGLAALGLSACGQQESAEPVETTPDGMPGVTVSDARLVLPAVSGNPAALYFDISYEGDDIAMIRGVHVDGAENAMMHATVESQGQTYMEELLQVKIENGETKKFERGGDHVMVMGLADTVKAGGTVEVTLTFIRGDKVSFPAEVLAAGDAR